ncbi:MAG: NUDIX hydrolase [Candidatus Omnitrophica bacterium]|nr:NUDIX hydrolase [Candidatus Omnitrophota bacterium]
MKDFKYCPHCKARLEWDIVEGAKRLICKKCKWIYYRNPLPVVACLVLRDKTELLLIRRGIEPAKGRWALPGGFIEFTEDVETAGKRELFEETGVRGSTGRLIGIESHISVMYGPLLVMGVEYKLGKKVTLSVGDDAMDARFFPILKLPKIPFKSHRNLIKAFLE